MSIEHYAIYVLATGNIAQWGTCGPGEGALVEPDAGRAVIYGAGGPWTARTHYVAAGVPVAYTAEQAAAKADRPSARGFVWSNATMAWVDARTLADVKQYARQLIRQEAKRRITARMGEVMADPDMLVLVKTIYLSIAAAARQPTADMQWLIDMAQAVQTAFANVTAATTKAEVAAVTVAWPT
jgi:hypothetical protein